MNSNTIIISVLVVVALAAFFYFGIYKRAFSIDSVKFNTFGWAVVQSDRISRSWQSGPPSESPTIISARIFSGGLEEGMNLEDMTSVRNFFRKTILPQNGGLIKVEKEILKNLSVIESIVKVPTKPSGMAYIGTLKILLKDYQIVVKIQAREKGMTGVRDTVIATKLMQSGEISLGDDGYIDWFNDPYDENYKEGTCMNLSESEEYDKDFPDHPLTQLRNILQEIKASIEFSNIVYKM